MVQPLYNIRMFCLVWILCITIIQQGRAQTDQEEIIRQQKDSVLTHIDNTTADGRYTDAHNEIVMNLYVYRNDYTMLPPLYAALSNLERLTGDNREALHYMEKSQEALLMNDKDYANKRMHYIYHRIANIYFEMRMFDSAYVFAKRSLTICEMYSSEQAFDYSRKLNLPIIGYHYFLEGDYINAEKTYNDAVFYCIKVDETDEISLIYMKLAEVKDKQNNYSVAVYWGDRALAMADSVKNNAYQLAAVNTMIPIYKAHKNYEKLAEYLQLKLDLEDEIKLTDQKKQLQELQTRYETRLKDEENKSLKETNKKQEIQNRFQVVVIVFSSLVLLIVLVFAISFFYQKRRISRQKEAVDSLNTLNRKIFSVISHDLKGPLLGIETLLDMNQKYKMDAEMFQNQTRQLKNDLKQANLIMENLLSWSKAETGASGFAQAEADLRRVTEEVILQLQTLTDHKKLEVKNHIPVAHTIPVPSDIMKIIYRNLLSNAIKYSYEGGSIVFDYDVDKKYYSVKDSGMGMEPDILGKLFRQETHSMLGTYHETGYGIGLNIVYELVRKYGGRVWAESHPGIGTTMFFYFYR